MMLNKFFYRPANPVQFSNVFLVGKEKCWKFKLHVRNPNLLMPENALQWRYIVHKWMLTYDPACYVKEWKIEPFKGVLITKRCGDEVYTTVDLEVEVIVSDSNLKGFLAQWQI